MIIRNISNPIQETLKARERALARKVAPPNASTEEGTLHYNDIATRSTFVTMASANGKPSRRRMIQGGEVLLRGVNTSFGFDSDGLDGPYQDYGLGYSGEGFRPISGITNISVVYKGGYRALREATVSWVANSFSDLDDLTPGFLTIGKSVLLEWGWVFSNPKINRKIAENSFIVMDAGTFTFHPDIFEDPQARIEAAGGNFDVLFGTVSNFDYQLNDSGGFNCTTKIVSTGVNMFDSQKAQVGSPDISSVIKSKEEKEKIESKKNMDGLVSSILNLEKIFIMEVAKLSGDALGFSGPERELVQKNYLNGFVYDSVFKNASFPNYNFNVLKDTRKLPNVSFIAQLGSEKDIVFSTLQYNFNVKNPNNTSKGNQARSSDFFVSFGWLEDNLFSRYLSYAKIPNGEILNTFRSVEPERDGNGNPIKNYGKTSEGYEIQLGPDGSYYYVDDDGKEQKIEQPPNADDNPTLTKYKNRSVLIRSHPKLVPIDPMKFFLPGQNIASTSINIHDVVNSEQAELVRSHFEVLLNVNSSVDKKFLDMRYDKARYGRLRRVMINTKEIKRAFGIDVGKTFNTFSSRTFKDSEVKPPKTMKEGIKRLLTNLSANFHNFWNFEIVADTINVGNMKVIDTNSSPEFDAKLYSEFKENSHKIQKRGVFKFPAYTLGSIVKSQELAFKIPDAQAVSAMYGSNQQKTGGIILDTSNENSIIQAVFANDIGDEYIDSRFQGMEKAHKLVDEGGHKIGAKNISEKITFEGPVKIEAGTSWWSSFSNIFGTGEPQNGVVSGATKKDGEEPNIYQQAEINAEGNKLDFNKSMEQLLTGKDGVDNNKIAALEKEIENIRDNDDNYNGIWPFKRLKRRVLIQLSQKQDELNKLRRGGLGQFYMLKPSTGGTDNVEGGFQVSLFVAGNAIVKSQLFSFDRDSAVYQSTYLIPAELSMTVDGVGGILPGEIIQTDYIQGKYNTSIKKDDRDLGPFAFFQVFGVEQKLDSNGWDTSITTKMRINNNVLEMDAAEVITIINEDKKANSAPVESLEAPAIVGEAQIPGQFSTTTGGKYGPEGNFDSSRGFTNNANISFGPDGMTKNQPTSQFGVPGTRTSTYDILRITPKFELVAPPTTPLEVRRENALIEANAEFSKKVDELDDFEIPDVAIEDFDEDVDFTQDGEGDFQLPSRYKKAEEIETEKQMEELGIKKGEVINDETAKKITDEEGKEEQIQITPVVSKKVTDLKVQSKSLEDSSNTGGDDGEKSSKPVVAVGKNLEEKLDSSSGKNSERDVEAVQEAVGAKSKETKYVTKDTPFSSGTLKYVRDLQASGRGSEVDRLISEQSSEIAKLLDPNLIRIDDRDGLNTAVYNEQGPSVQNTPPSTFERDLMTTISETNSKENVSNDEKIEKVLTEKTKQSGIVKKMKEANKESNKSISNEIKKKKPIIPKVQEKEANFASTFWGAADQNNDYIYELIPGWKPDTIKANPRTGQAAGTRDGKVDTDRRRKFWDEMIEPQRDLNKTPTGKSYGNIYAYGTGKAGEKPGYAESDLSVVKDSFEKLKGQFDYARNDTPNGEDVVWTPRFSRPNPNGKAKA